MSSMPELQHADDILVRLSNSHSALHFEQSSYDEEQTKAVNAAWTKYAPRIAEAHSVFLQVKAEAYRAGFTDTEINKLLSH